MLSDAGEQSPAGQQDAVVGEARRGRVVVLEVLPILKFEPEAGEGGMVRDATHASSSPDRSSPCCLPTVLLEILVNLVHVMRVGTSVRLLRRGESDETHALQKLRAGPHRREGLPVPDCRRYLQG